MKHILRAPTFASEDKTRIARLLNVILFATIGVNLVYSFSLLFTLPEPELNLVADGVLLLLQLIALILMRRGELQMASIVLVTGLWLYSNFVILVFGGSRSPATIIYFLVILSAGLLLGGRVAVLLSIVTVFAAMGLLWVELAGRLPESMIPITPVYTWVALIMGIAIMAVLLHLAMRSLHEALGRARENGRALAEKNKELEATQVILEQRVQELKQAEAALRASEERLRTVVNNAPVILWGVDRNGVLTFLEGATLDDIEIDPEEFVGLSVFEISDERVPQLAGQFRRAMEGETFTTVERMRGRIFEMRYAPMLQGSDRVVGVIGIAVDITERRQAEEALFQAQKSESLGILAGGIAHDFNNLLVAMLGQTSLAQSQLPPGHQVQGYLEKAVVAAQKAATLTRQMLAYSGRGDFEIRPIHLNRLIEENIHLFEAAIPKNVQLAPELSADLPLIEGDPAQMQQVIMNLILNAVEAIGPESGRVVVRTYLTDGELEEPFQERYAGSPALKDRGVAVEVSDDGCGMERETVARIFDPFYSTKPTGQGLGLAAVLGIVKGHNGRIQVNSEPGEGTTFRLMFPVSERSLPQEPEKVQRTNGQLHDRSLVLVIDDEEPVRMAVNDILALEGIDVIVAANGAQAVTQLRAHAGEVDLIILDLSMPGLSGQETLAQLRAIDPEVPVLLSSGYDKRDVRHRFNTDEVSGFLQKPYDGRTLVDTVLRYLERDRG
jgi:PAS domain S-box-containing protein